MIKRLFGAHLNRHYFYISWWLIKDSAWRFRRRFLAIVVLLGLDLLFQVSAFAIVISYLNSLQAGQGFKLLHHNFQHLDPTQLLVFSTLAAGFLLILSAGAHLIGRFLVVGLVRSYEEFCGRRVLNIFARGAEFSSTGSERVDSIEEDILRLINKDGRLCSRAINDIFAGVIPICYVVISASFAIYTNLALTIILVGVFSIALRAYLGVGRKGASALVQLEKYSRKKGQKLAEGVRRLNSSFFSPQEERRWISNIYQDESARAYQDAFQDRVRVAHISIFIGSIQMAVGLMIIVAYFGLTLDRSAIVPVSYMIKYAISLRIFYSNARSVGRVWTNLNSLYPFIQRYVEFTTRHGLSNHSISVSGESGLNILIRSAMGARDEVEISIRNGKRYNLVADRPLNRLNLAYLVRSVLGKNDSRWDEQIVNASFVSSSFLPPALILDKYVAPFGGVDLQKMREVLSGYPDRQRVDQVGTWLSPEVQLDQWNSFSAEGKFLLSCVDQKLQLYRQFVFVSFDDLAKLSVPEQRFVQKLFSDRIFMVSFDPMGAFDCVEDQLLLISEGDSFVAPRASLHLPSVEEILNKIRERRRPGSARNIGSTSQLDDLLLDEDEL